MADCGVYRITCAANSRVYIGSSVGMAKRFGEHRSALRYSRHHSLLLQRAWNKYGEDAFIFEPLLRCAASDRIFYEQRAIDAFDSANPAVGMNRSAIAVGSPPIAAFKGRHHSDATRKLLSERLMGRKTWNKGRVSPMRGIRRDPDVAAKIRDAKRSGGSITMDIARAIRTERLTTDKTVKQIAEKFGATHSVARRVIEGASWVEKS